MITLHLELRLGYKPPYPEGRKNLKSVGQELCRSWVDAPYNLPFGAIHFDCVCDLQSVESPVSHINRIHENPGRRPDEVVAWHSSAHFKALSLSAICSPVGAEASHTFI